MNVFLIVGGLVLVGVLAAIVYPLLKRQPLGDDGASEQRELNLRVLREQLAELEKEFADGRISEPAYLRSKSELEQRTLDYVGEPTAAVVSGGRKTALAIALAIGFPAVVGGLYWTLGVPDSVVPSQSATVTKEGEHALSQQQITAMVERLALRLQENPEDGAGWLMLGRSYAVLGRYPESSAAYGRALKLLPPDAQHYADYADIVAMSQGKKLLGEPEKLVRRALEIDPRNIKALALAGTIAFDRQEYAKAIGEWQKVQALVPADSSAAAGITGSIRDAENRLAISTKQVSEVKPVAGSEPTAIKASISGTVELDTSLRTAMKPGDTLFIFARAVEGPRMPVAMIRAKAGELPMTFTLDDSMAMSPQFKLSTVGRVVVGARISKSGDALARSGDLEGLSAPISAKTGNVKITINTTVQ